jgi:glycosyltransferase involved in cell wall biosynthesis
MRDSDQINLFQAMAGAHHGGAELFFERLAGAFQACGVKQHLVIKHDAERRQRLKNLGITVNSISYSPLLKPVNRAYLAQSIRNSEANVILSWMNRAASTMPVTKIPHVARLGGFYSLKYYRHCDWLVGNVPAIVDYLIAEGWPKTRVHHQTNFVPDGLHGPTYALPRTQHAVVPPVTIVALGRLHPNKGFDTLIKAIERFEPGQLVLAGSGAEEGALKQLAADLNISQRVHFIGWQSDPQKIIRAANIFICPSRHEPFGNVIAEAMSCGKPVIATETHGAKNLVEHEVSGLLVPIDDIAAMADAMMALHRTPQAAQAMADAARAYWQKHLAPDQVTKSWIAFLHQVAMAG